MGNKNKKILQNNKSKNFVQRILNPENYPVLNLPNGDIATHMMQFSTGEDSSYVYPSVIYDNNQLIQLSPDSAYNHAMSTGEYISFPNSTSADDFSRNYKTKEFLDYMKNKSKKKGKNGYKMPDNYAAFGAALDYLKDHHTIPIGDIISSATAGLASIIPEQTDTKFLRPEEQFAYNPFPMGTNSSALFKNGGNIRKKHNISIEEDYTPASGGQSQIPIPSIGYSSAEPLLPSQGITSTNFIGPSPIEENPKKISFEKLFDNQGNITGYSPLFSGYNHNEAMQDFSSLPDDFGGIPVIKSPDLFAELNQNFYPDTYSDQWQPFSSMKDGGKVKKPIYTGDKNDPRIKRYNDSLNAFTASKAVVDFASSNPNFTPRQLDSISNRIDPNRVQRNFTDNRMIPEDFVILGDYIHRNKQRYPIYRKPTQPLIYDPNRTPVDQMNTIPQSIQEQPKPIPRELKKKGYGPHYQYRQGISSGLESDPDYNDPRTQVYYTFEDGGTFPTANSDIYIKPESRGSLHRALNIPEGEKIPVSMLQDKPGDSKAMKRKKLFARNSRKFSHKENGGFIEGGEYDLDPQIIQQMLLQGYELDF